VVQIINSTFLTLDAMSSRNGEIMLRYAVRRDA
jgi:hypothetical protein